MLRSFSRSTAASYLRSSILFRSSPEQKRQLCSPVNCKSDEHKINLLRKGIAPATGRPLKEIQAEVWGHSRDPAQPGQRSGEKLLRRPLRGHLFTSWYPPPISSYKSLPFKLTEKQERWKVKLKTLRASGKGPPKKGAGKRSK